MFGILAVMIAVAMTGSPNASAETPPGVSWKKLPNMSVPRWEAGTAVLDKKLYVFGGYEMPTKACKRADVFDPKTGGWTKLKDLPSAVTHMNMVIEGRSIWFAGGFKDGYKGYTITEVWKYDVDKNTYAPGPSLPESRGSGGLAIVGRKLHYIGGLTKDRNTCSPKHWVLDLEKSDAEWTDAKPMSKGRCHFGTVTFEGKIYVIGGMYHHDKGQADLPLVDIYDSKTDSWSKGAQLPTGHTHAEGATFVHQKRIYFMGGMAQVGKRRWIDNNITVSTPDGGWKHVGRLPRNLSAPAAGVIGDKLYLAGGSLNGGHPQPGMWVCSVPTPGKPAGAVDLFDGKSLDGWEHYLVDPKLKMSDVWSVRDGLLVCKGKPMGYLATKKEYVSFKLIVEWRWPPGKPATNSGVLMRITGKPQALPKCVEAQLKSGSAGDVYGFHGFNVKGSARVISAENKFVGKLSGVSKMKAAEKKPGQWNKYEITFNGGDITVILNGQKVNEATGCDVVAGKIGLQSEGGEVHFRTVRLTPLSGKAVTTPKAQTAKPGAQVEASKEVTLGDGKKATVRYLFSLPETYNKADKHPLLIFLHGMGERGDNLNRVKFHGPPKIVSRKNTTGFIIVSPQCPKTEFWKIEKLSKLLDHILATTKADPQRVYLTGLSMGGFGTWAWASRQPERFAAAAPICGGGDPRTAKKLINLPIWAFHGDKDNVVPLARTQAMVDAVKKAGGTKIKLTVYPGVRHNSWTKTYANPDMYKWLLTHRRTASR
jgi:predicted esterase